MGGERTAILSHPAGCFFLLLLPLYRLLDRLSMVTVGKIFARQGEIHLCFRLQLKITDLMFNLNINKKTAPLPTFLPAEGCVFSAHFFIFTTSKSRSCYPAVGKNMIMLDSNMPYRNQSRIHYYCTPLQLPSFDTYNHHLNLLLFRKAGVNHHYRIHLVQRLCNRYRNCLH